MAPSAQKAPQRWSDDEVRKLRQLARENTPTRVIGLKLRRSEPSIRSKAAHEGISLKPTNQRPFGSHR
jgi:hypothetical protein